MAIGGYTYQMLRFHNGIPGYKLLFAFVLFGRVSCAQNTPFTISSLTISGTTNNSGVVAGSGTATVSGIAGGTVSLTETGMSQIPCGGTTSLNQVLTFDSSDSLTLSENFPANCTGGSSTMTVSFNVSGGTGMFSGRSGSGTLTITTQTSQVNGVVSYTRTGSGSGTLSPQIPTIAPSGVVPVYSNVTTIQPGEWVSIFGTGFASSTTSWNGDFPTSLGGTSVTIDGKLAYLWYVSPAQINLQVPADTQTGTVPVVVKTATGTSTSTVTLAAVAPSFSLLDTKHVTGIILRGDGSGAYGGGTYDILGPTGNSLGYATVAAKPGDFVELFAVGLGPTTPTVQPGQAYAGSAPTVSPVNILINNVSVTPSFAGLSGAGVYQINLLIPTGLGTGDIPLVASTAGVQTQAGIVIALQRGPVPNQNLTISTSGTGGGTVSTSPAGTSCGTGCLTFPGGTVVTLTPNPVAGSVFAGWSGACSGTNGCSITMNADQSVSAAFGPLVNPALTIVMSGTGTGTISSSPAGTSCGSGCLSFSPGTAVTLTPTAATGSMFGGWYGSCSAGAASPSSSSSTLNSDTNICHLTMSSSQTITATFNMSGFVSGIAASGSAIAGASVTLRDSTGVSSSATTDPKGAYVLSTAGMTPPFLVQVQTSTGKLYSVSADALTTTTINTHPYTDLMIRSWYAAQGKDVDSAFSNPVSLPAPGPVSVALLSNATTGLAQLWLANAGVNTSQFNLISSPFAADHTGLDQVLDESVVNASAGTVVIAAGGTTQTSTIIYNSSASTMTITSTTAGPGGTSLSSNAIVVPAQTAQQSAVNGMIATLTGFFNAISSASGTLTSSQLTPFMASDLIHDGLNQNQLAASLATTWRGSVVPTVQLQKIKSIDLTHGVADIVITQNQSEFWFENVAGTWLIGGDNQIAAVNLTAQSDTYEGTQSGSGPQINIQVLAPQGTVTGVKVTDASGITGYQSTKIQQGSVTVDYFQPTPGTTLTVNIDSFIALSSFLGNLVPAGTMFTFAVTPSSGPVVTYAVPSNVFTSDTVTITSPTTGTLSNYTLGQPLAVQWTLPGTYPLANVSLNAVAETGPDGPTTTSCAVSGSSYSTAAELANASSGTITIPATCNGQPVLNVHMTVLARGVNGEQAYSILSTQ